MRECSPILQFVNPRLYGQLRQGRRSTQISHIREEEGLPFYVLYAPFLAQIIKYFLAPHK
jgi:hypothetical protein